MQVHKDQVKQDIKMTADHLAAIKNRVRRRQADTRLGVRLRMDFFILSITRQWTTCRKPISACRWYSANTKIKVAPDSPEIIKTIYPEGYVSWCGWWGGKPVWI